MANSSKSAFAERLVEAMLDRGYPSKRGAKAGVDAAPLIRIAGVTREMARRYTLGKALPETDKLNLIAAALNVRVAWLRDGELPKQAVTALEQPGVAYALPEDAVEVARAWLALPDDTREVFRDLIFMEAVVHRMLPWLQTHKPNKARYREFEISVQREYARLGNQLPLNI